MAWSNPRRQNRRKTRPAKLRLHRVSCCRTEARLKNRAGLSVPWTHNSSNMDTELFMECEEEELEPWQQVDDSVDEDDMDFMDAYGEPVEDSPSPLPASETPPPTTPPLTTPAVLTAPSVPSSVIRPPAAPSLPVPIPATAATGPLMAQAPPFILTQTASGTFLLPAAPGTSNAPPILLTTQGFPLQTVVNPGAPLLLNLQGQTMHLIQSPSLGQLVRPAVGVSSVLPQGQAFRTKPGTAPSGGLAHPVSGITTMKLPATLTIRTSTPGPVNLQMTQVGGANSLKVAGSPALPSGSANGITRTPPCSNAPVTALPSGVTSTATSDPSRVVMSVEDFYYGTFEGDVSLRGPKFLGVKSLFTCQICSHSAGDNLSFMQHMLQHSELIGGGAGDDRKCCRHCYRLFSSPTQLQTHRDQVHGSTFSSCVCRICEWAFENEPGFLNHMKTNHKPGEMPYICQVCSFRSSFYSDILQHFANFHIDTRFLLCLFCLKVTKNPSTYQQHLLRHQINQAFHCNRCRLQFVFLKDKMQHKLENHRTFRRPPQLDGLLPGSKVTIRTFGKMRTVVPSFGSTPFIQPINIQMDLQKTPRSPPKKPIGRRLQVKRSLVADGERLSCLECGTDASDLASHYPNHVKCLLCRYSSCCSRAYAAHMIQHHVSGSTDRALPLHRRPPPCLFLLQCAVCDFSPQYADQMAEHLLRNPEHEGCFCGRRTYIEQDIQLRHDKEPLSAEEEEQGQNKDLPSPSWRSADCWKQASESDGTKLNIVPFTQSSGPRHFLSKNSDAIDFFNLLFPPELVELITNETNAHVKTCQYLGTGPADWVTVTTHEVKGFIGLVILMGIQNLPDPSQYWSWSHYDNSYTFYRAMSFKRFKQIAANIRMGSFTTEQYRCTTNPSDSLHIFRPMLDILGKAMWDAYQPNCCLTIDRTLLSSLEEKSSHGKGNPKTQPQLWLLCDSKSGYCHRFVIQMGQKDGRSSGFTVVPQLTKGLEDKYHQLYLANSLTSVPLMQKLLDQGIYASSSFPSPNPILPGELWVEGRLEKAGDFLQRQFGPLLATRWKDTKEMGCLSTNAPPGQPDTVWRRSQTKVGELDPIQRPMAFRLLQENMRGVDICKQLLACNPLGGIPQDRHWRSLFWFLVNLSIVNAFIVLRESRKENPPAWVQDGLFTQVNFRKRLGNQLAKYAQKYFETMEMASARGVRGEVVDEPVKQRHRMGKISSISKRCKNCSLKNMRHESVYGCVTCKASLCKQPACFWEFHGLSPLNKGSAKIGFLKDRISGEVEVDEVRDHMGEAMAPVEEMDFSEDEKVEDLDDMDEETEEIKAEVINPPTQPASATNGHAQTASVLPGAKGREDFLTARQLRIALFALCGGVHQASQDFATEPQLIRSWLKEARKLLNQTEREHDAHTEGEDHMVGWVLAMREQQLPITESSLFHKASTFKKKGGFSDSFRISYDWAVSFMLQHRLGPQSPGRTATLGHALPRSLELKVNCFTKFTQKLIQSHNLPADAVAAMDELCLFVDFRLFQDKSRRSEALKLSASSLPVVTVYLTVLADGTMLPSLVLANGQMVEKTLPEFIQLESGSESLLMEDALELWTKRIWVQHMSLSSQPSKSMVVLDRHREHMADSFLTAVSGSGTLPAVIPAGCSFRLQPLEICVKPVLQRFLLSRWAKFISGDAEEVKEETSTEQLQGNITQLLVDWLVEALTRINELSGLLKKSFCLTGLLPANREDFTMEDEEETKTQSLEEIQSGLLQSLTEILLGRETLDADSPDRLDEEETEEEEQTERETKKSSEEGMSEREDEEKVTEDREKDGNETGEERKGREEDEEEEGKESQGDRGNQEEETKTKRELDEDSEEEEKETEEDREEEEIMARRETRIVIGEEVGEEWKITVKSRMEADGEENRME